MKKNMKKEISMIQQHSKGKGYKVNSSVINLSRRNLSEAKIFLLCKGLKFVPTANKFRPKSTFNPRNKDQGTRILLLKHILVV